MMASMCPASGNASLTNVISYRDPQMGRSRVGHSNFAKKIIQSLDIISEKFLDNLYQVIEAGKPNVVGAGEPIYTSSTKNLPPFVG
jgi:hypothetical protein